MDRARLFFAVLAASACSSSATMSMSEMAVDAGPACSGVATMRVCPKGTCPPRYTTAQADWCPAGGTVEQPVAFGDCGGFKIARLLRIDSSDFVFYGADGALLGVQHVAPPPLGGGFTCVPGVPATLDAANCTVTPAFTCGQ
jgi:hypothetical protein